MFAWEHWFPHGIYASRVNGDNTNTCSVHYVLCTCKYISNMSTKTKVGYEILTFFYIFNLLVKLVINTFAVEKCR